MQAARGLAPSEFHPRRPGEGHASDIDIDSA